MVKVKIQKVSESAKLPTKKEEDAGWDCYINGFERFNGEKFVPMVRRISDEWIESKEISMGSNSIVLARLGFKTEIPKGYYAQLVPRSGFAAKYGLTIINSPATIDSGYRGEWKAILTCIGDGGLNLKIGDKICQFILRKDVETDLVLSDDLSESERGEKGYGSSGR